MSTVVSRENMTAHLEKKLGYVFKQSDYLITALTHRSASSKHNERLEFLGDAILNFVIAEVLYTQHPQANEGELSRMRATLVKQDSLATIARTLELSDYLVLGSGELKSGGFRRDSILADTLEAIIAAIYLDNGLDETRKRILDWFAHALAHTDLASSEKDYKTQLQEYLQARRLPLPEYEVTQIDGKDHDQIFYVRCCLIDPACETKGHGSNRRRAEQMAAEQLFKELTHV